MNTFAGNPTMDILVDPCRPRHHHTVLKPVVLVQQVNTFLSSSRGFVLIFIFLLVGFVFVWFGFCSWKNKSFRESQTMRAELTSC